jgi:hypothetical protein
VDLVEVEVGQREQRWHVIRPFSEELRIETGGLLVVMLTRGLCGPRPEFLD